MNTANATDEATTGLAAGLGLVIIIVGVVVLILLHFLPGIIASARKHPQAGPIWLVNIFLGWTIIGWFAALIWAFVTERALVAVPMAMPPQAPPQPVAAPVQTASSAMVDEIAALARLRDQGVLTEAEFTARKHLLLGETGHPAAPPEPSSAPTGPVTSEPPPPPAEAV